jgi:hypothetical protein
MPALNVKSLAKTGIDASIGADTGHCGGALRKSPANAGSSQASVHAAPPARATRVDEVTRPLATIVRIWSSP